MIGKMEIFILMWVSIFFFVVGYGVNDIIPISCTGNIKIKGLENATIITNKKSCNVKIHDATISIDYLK